MQDNIDKIFTNMLKVNLDPLNNVNNIINEIKIAINNNKENIEKANFIDKKNNNGFILDFDVINNIFSNVEEEDLTYQKVIYSQKNDEKKILYGIEVMPYGNIVVINDGNPYIILEMILKNILVGNKVIFSNSGYMFGTNNLIIQIVQSVLEQFNISKYLIQIYITEDFKIVLNNYANIDLVICIGNRSLQTVISNISKNSTIYSGYENFDLYIEDKTNIDFVNKILNTGLNIQLYVNSKITIEYQNTIIVNDIDEAIAQINYNGSKYSSSIFTTSSENASKFVKEVKSKIVTVNTSPTIERIIDINQEDLVIKKKIIYPINFK